MSALDAARDHYVARFQDFERQLGASDPAWLTALRREAIAAFAERGLPSTKLEEWRYTSVAALAKLRFELPRSPTAAPTREDVEALSIPVFACSLFVFVDGRFEPALSTPPTLSGGIVVESLARLRSENPEALAPHFGQLASAKRHPFAALNAAFTDDGAVLFVPENTQLERPMHVVFLSTASERPTVHHPRVLLVAGTGSRVAFIQDHVSLGEAAGFTNAVTEAYVGRNARLDLALVQREGGKQFHVSNLQVRQERDSRFASHTVTLGGGLVRNDLGAVLAAEGAECTLHGLFVADGSELVDNHTLVDHAMPHGTSRELYKGILAGRSRGVFRGRMIVRPDAQKTNAQQSNPNLLLSDGAEIDTKPQLEIHADDVKCSHGSSIGQVDPDALFYVRTRGIGEREARDLLARGFGCEVTTRIPIEPLRQEIDTLVLKKLARSAPAEEST
jgi:Fe-S cluster assembly protein SufD